MQSRYPNYSSGINPQKELEKFTIQISRPGEEAALGTGILVTNDGLIATCYHVIESIIKSRSAGSGKKYASVSFSNGAIKLQAEILEQYCKEDLDVAILRIDKIPDDYEEAKLGIRIREYTGHRFVSRGYRKNKRYSHQPSDGTISDIVYSKELSTDVIRLESPNYGEEGMSGSAVYDIDVTLGIVIGMMRFRDEDKEGVDDKASYATPSSTIIRCCPEIEVKNRGLVVNEFLNLIDPFDYESYKDIDHLWVPPKEYDNIITALERDRVAIITGPPEYGKTYTAIRILWEYYHKRYFPKLLEIEDTALDRTSFRSSINRTLNVASQREHIIIHLNEPFGKSKLVEDYVDDVKFLLNKLKIYKNARLIINSRESNYRKIQQRHDLFPNDIESVLRFNVTGKSYDPEKREKILLMHARNIDCAWIKDKETKKMILSLLRGDSRNLPTLLNILNFVQQTVDVYGGDINKWKTKMKPFSEETPKAFAKEIREEHYDLMEFLSFPFISKSFETAFVRSQYNELRRDKKNGDLPSFEQIATKFKDKISTKTYVSFKHPSYSEALPFLLEQKYDTIEERQNPSPVIEGFAKVLLKLVDTKEGSGAVAVSVANNYDKLQPRFRQLLFKLAENGKAVWFIVREIANNFEKLAT